MNKTKPRTTPRRKTKQKNVPTPAAKPTPIWMACVQQIQANKNLTLLQKVCAVSYLLERTKYRPPSNATHAEIKKVLLSGALADARFWFPDEMTEEECKRRTFLHTFILAPNDKKLAAPPWKMTREEWTNFFRSAEQARQTFLAQFKNKKPMLVHSKYRSAFLPIEDLAIIHRWTSPDADGVSLAHCTAELACEIIGTFSEAGHDPKNFSRKKRQLALVSYSKPENRGHLY